MSDRSFNGKPRRNRPVVLASSVAAGFNALAALGCAGLVVVAPSRAGILLALAGVAFFGLAAAGFALMRRAAATTPRDERRAR